MRRSSRGNPWHDARGRFCHGPEAKVDTWGNPISDEQRREAVSYCEAEQAEYQARSEARGVTVGGKYYSKDTANDPPTDKQRRFAKAIAKRLGKELPEETKKGYSDFIGENAKEFYAKKDNRPKVIVPAVDTDTEQNNANPLGTDVAAGMPKMPTKIKRGKEGATAFARECAEAFGASCDGVFFDSAPMSSADGRVISRIENGSNTYHCTNCTVTSKHDKASQVHNTYHEVFHLARNGNSCPGDDTDSKRYEEIEEVKAEVAAIAMCEDNGIDGKSTAYSEIIVSTLPRLKRMKKYENCKTMSDFGKIFIADRRAGNISHEAERIAVSKRFNEGEYLCQYREEAEKHFDDVYEKVVKKRSRSPKFRAALLIDFRMGLDRLEMGVPIRNLSRNQRILVGSCIRKAMEKGGIL